MDLVNERGLLPEILGLHKNDAFGNFVEAVFGDLRQPLSVETVVAVDKEHLEVLDGTVDGALHGKGCFSSFRFTIDQRDRFRRDTSAYAAVDAFATCLDCNHAVHVKDY